jgi:hypothetical protein
MSIEDLIRQKYAAQVEASRLAGSAAAQIGAPAHNTMAQSAMMNAQANRDQLPIQWASQNTNQFRADTDRWKTGYENDELAARAARENALAEGIAPWRYNGGMGMPSGSNVKFGQPFQSSAGSDDATFDRSARTMYETVPTRSNPDRLKELGLKRGTTRVPGKGSGKVDTVDAKLAPGEAVLNKAAAESMGRDKIAAANAAGAKKMGLGMYSRDERRYAAGTPRVSGGSTGRGGGQDYPAAMGPGQLVPMMSSPPVVVPTPHFGIVDPGEGGATGNGSPYMLLEERGMTPRYAMGTENVQPQGMGMMPRSLGSERARQGLDGFIEPFSTAQRAARLR